MLRCPVSPVMILTFIGYSRSASRSAGEVHRGKPQDILAKVIKGLSRVITSEMETISNVIRPAVIRPVFVRVAIEEWTRRGMVVPHQHTEYEIVFVDKGIYRCRLNDADLILGKNELLIVNPGDWHADFYDGKYLRYLALGFSLNLAAGTPLLILRDNVPVTRRHFNVRRLEFLPLIEKISRELPAGAFVSAHILDALTLELFYRIIRAIPGDILSNYYVETSQEASFSTILLLAINKRLTQMPSVRELASALGISESSLAHKCRKILHCSPKHLLLRVKMDRAMQMLKSTNMLVKEVAACLGFVDAFRFSRVFKQVFGKAPSAVKHDPPPAC